MRFIRNSKSPSLLALAAAISASVNPKATANVLDCGRIPPCTISRSSCTIWFRGKPKDFTALTPTVVNSFSWSISIPAASPGPSKALNASTRSSLVAAVRRAASFKSCKIPPEICIAWFHSSCLPLISVIDCNIPAIPKLLVSMPLANSKGFFINSAPRSAAL